MRIALALFVFLAPTLALAQPHPPPAPPPLPQTTPQAPIAVPPPPKTDDPMLVPVPPAARTIASWNDALGYIRSRSTDLRIAYLEVKRAEAQSREAVAALLPSLNGTTTGTHNFITNSVPQVIGVVGNTNVAQTKTIITPAETFANGNLQLAVPIIAPRLWNGLKSAQINEEVNRLSVDDTKRTIALNVANAVVGVVTAERVADLNRVGLKAALERLELTQRKRGLGAATGLDVIRVQQDVENAKATLVTGDESLLEARESLGLALGISEAVGVEHGVDLNGLAAATLASCQPTANLADRPDLQADRRRIDLVHQSVVVDAWTQFSPVLTAQSNINTTTQDVGASPNTTWNIQGVLTWNIWDGGNRYGLLRDGRAQEEEARQRLEAATRTAQIQLDQARRGISVAEQSRKVADDARALAAEVDRLTQTGYLEGQGTSLDLVIAAAALRQADINLALQEFGLVKARILAVLTLATCPL